MRWMMAAALAVAASPAWGEDLRFGPPIACEPGATCWVQNYFDHDPSDAVKDYACGAATYDGHDGTDIRIRDTAARADVIASAAGVVMGGRDGVEDNLMKTEEDRARVGDRECGNGVVIDHGGGWETQYCHMREGTVAVKKGERVAAGQKLGEVGYSGMAAFPHVHLSVRKDGKELDPFTGAAGSGACGETGNHLWTDEAMAALAYQRGAIIGAGFAAGAVEMEALEQGVAEVSPGSDWPALVAYAWLINLEEGDELIVEVSGPNGLHAENRVTLDRAKAQYLLFTGKKRPGAGWAKGEYAGRARVMTDGVARLEKVWRVVLD